MKRGLALALCAAVVAAMAGPAFAVVNVQLNLRYTNPNNPNGGGTWDLLAQSNTAGTNGISGLRVTLGGNLGVTGIDTPNNAILPNNAVFNNTTGVFKYKLVSAGRTEITVGDDLVAANLITGVGRGGSTPGNVPNDDLFPTNSVTWDNSALLASGSWTGARPTLVAADVKANEFGAGNVVGAAVIGTVSVRGDSVGVDGLKPGDTNRDGAVNLDDFNKVFANFFTTGKTWDDGDSNSDGAVNLDDFNAVFANFFTTSPAPAVAAVPEPASFAVSAIALLGLAATRRKLATA